MSKVLQTLFILMLLGICLLPFIHGDRPPSADSQLIPSTSFTPIGTRGWWNASDPLQLTLDTYYTIPSLESLCYATFFAQAGDLYYIYLHSIVWWDAELYNDSAYQLLLGTFYKIDSSLPHSLTTKYLTFSAAHTGAYYLILYGSGFTGKLAILNATLYTVNTTQMVIISPETNPVKVFQVDLVQGNYSTPADTLYLKVERGWNYAFLPSSYGALTPTVSYLANGTYGIIVLDSCNFCLTGYQYFPKNETIPDDPDGENKTDITDPGSIFDGITPLFGIGVLVGLCALYKFKKK